MSLSSSRALAGIYLFASGLVLFPADLRAASDQVAIRFFPDVTTSFAGQTFDDEDVVEELRPAGTLTQISLGAIPGSAALGAYHVRAGGTQVVSFETTVVLPGGLVAEPRDVVQTNFDGTASYSSVFDGSANGVPAGARVDAIGFTNNVGGDILLSFDTTVTLPGPITADDEDVVQLTGSSFTILFDGSAAGVPAGLDLDGFNLVTANGHLLVSFDTSGIVGGVAFQDEDVLEYTPSGSTWEMAYDGSALHPDWPATNLGGADILTDLDSDEQADEYETNTGIYLSQYDTGTDPADTDTDNDLLIDGVETSTGVYSTPQNTGTSPLDQDSDDDGFNDGVEVNLGSDPNDPQSTPTPNVPALGMLGYAVLILGLLAGARRGLRRR